MFQYHLKMSKRVQTVQLTMFHFSAKRARGSSETACVSTTLASAQLEPSPSESQVCNIDMSDSVSSASSSTVNSPEYTLPINYYSSDEEPISLMAEFSGDSDNSQHSFLTVNDVTPGPSTINSLSTTVSVASTAKSTVVAKPDTLPGRSMNTTVPNDIAQTAEFPPVRPVNVKFPATKFGTTTRTFNVVWYDKFRWLEYSVQHDASYCYPYHVFGTSSYGRSRPEHAFIDTGFRNWKKATGKDGVLNRHANSVSHKQAWHQYKCNSEQGTSIPDRMNSARSVTIAQNRHYSRNIVVLWPPRNCTLYGSLVTLNG